MKIKINLTSIEAVENMFELQAVGFKIVLRGSESVILER